MMLVHILTAFATVSFALCNIETHSFRLIRNHQVVDVAIPATFEVTQAPEEYAHFWSCTDFGYLQNLWVQYYAPKSMKISQKKRRTLCRTADTKCITVKDMDPAMIFYAIYKHDKPDSCAGVL